MRTLLRRNVVSEDSSWYTDEVPASPLVQAAAPVSKPRVRHELKIMMSKAASITALTLCFGVLTAAPVGAEDPVRIERLEAWRSAFGGKQIKLRVDVQSSQPRRGRLVWGLTADKLPLDRGEAQLVAPGEVELSLELPAIKPGIVQKVSLSAAFQVEGEREAAAVLQDELYLFAPDPFADRRRRLERLQIVIYDPNGVTAEQLESARIPCEVTRNLAMLEQLDEGLVVIGEGLSLRTERALPEIVLGLARRGVPVLCLAPTEGPFPLPLVRQLGEAAAASLLFEGRAAISRLDKRLDPAQWMSTAVTPTHTLALQGEGAEVIAGDAGWPWVEIRLKNPAGKNTPVIINCFPIIAHWDQGPTPRYLFSELLDYLHAPAASLSHVRNEP